MTFRRYFTPTKLIYGGLLAAGIIFGWFLHSAANNNPMTEKVDDRSTPFDKSDIYAPHNTYKFINPLLSCGDLPNTSDKQVNKTKTDIENFINNEKVNGNIDFVAVYFRDLNNGPWFGINENEEFIPGSLLKVPLMLSVFKAAEADAGLLSEEVLYEGGDSNELQYFKPAKAAETGKIYSVENLVELSIKYSDNNAALLLWQLLGADKRLQSYTELGVPIPINDSPDVQVKSYASFFRVLYNASYLNKNLSEKALSILSQSTFDQGLTAGVPKGTVVAHKFGERSRNNTQPEQLHDCGIIYYPNKPYLLCVMTRGGTVANMTNIIKNISKMVWQSF